MRTVYKRPGAVGSGGGGGWVKKRLGRGSQLGSGKPNKKGRGAWGGRFTGTDSEKRRRPGKSLWGENQENKEAIWESLWSGGNSYLPRQKLSDESKEEGPYFQSGADTTKH